MKKLSDFIRKFHIIEIACGIFAATMVLNYFSTKETFTINGEMTSAASESGESVRIEDADGGQQANAAETSSVIGISDGEKNNAQTGAVPAPGSGENGTFLPGSNPSSDGKENDTAAPGSGSIYSTCYISISCEPFLDDASPSALAKLPSDGIILDDTEVEFKEGDTVYDVLKRVCSAKHIPIKASKSQYGAYVSSIDNLSEKYYDMSTGWYYYVNGDEAVVGCDSYVVEEGDMIEWKYDSWD